jgi:hypothetical protein
VFARPRLIVRFPSNPPSQLFCHGLKYDAENVKFRATAFERPKMSKFVPMHALITLFVLDPSPPPHLGRRPLCSFTPACSTTPLSLRKKPNCARGYILRSGPTYATCGRFRLSLLLRLSGRQHADNWQEHHKEQFNLKHRAKR